VGLLDSLSPGEHLATYDVIVQRLRDQLSWVQRWRTMQGDEDDLRPWVDGETPGILTVPTLEDVGWYSEAAFRGRLVVTVELAMMTADVRDFGRAWRAVKEAFYPIGDRTAREAVRDAISEVCGGMSGGLVAFGGISYPRPQAGILTAQGRLSVLINEDLNP
jgi:hypothetical protein